MQLEPELLARLADLGRLGRAPAGGGVAAVALPAEAAAGDGDPRAGVGEVGDRLAGLAQAHLRADRHLELAVLAAAAVLPRALAVDAALRAEVRGRAKRERSRRSGSATSTTSPPSPPSPPSGPPLGTYFSRRKLTQPSPPRPPSTWIVARSANTGRRCYADCSASTLM